jgi:outer membrane immunogenic protein
MKRLSLGIAVAAALGLVAGPVSAADLPVKAPPPMVMPALYNWSGLYIGVEGGAVMGQRTEILDLLDPTQTDFGHPVHGGFVGGEAGFNWQSGRWVFGIEGDGNWAEIEGASIHVGTQPFGCSLAIRSCGTKIRDFETVRARIGYAYGPTGSFLVYVTGGWATASQDYLLARTTTNAPAFFTWNEWKRTDGFVVGGGAEYGITPWLSLKAEALFVQLGRRTYCGLSPTCEPFIAAEGFTVEPVSIRTNFVVARMGLNARFWWGKAPTPVVARY